MVLLEPTMASVVYHAKVEERYQANALIDWVASGLLLTRKLARSFNTDLICGLKLPHPLALAFTPLFRRYLVVVSCARLASFVRPAAGRLECSNLPRLRNSLGFADKFKTKKDF